MTPDEYVDAVSEIWTGVAEASAKLADSFTDLWWRSLPVARPDGLDITSVAKIMAARIAKLGPDGDPLESLTLGTIAYAQGTHDQAMAEVREIEQLRTEYHERAEQRDDS